MSQFIEDLLCGMLGYGLGKRNREFTQEEVDVLIRSFLQGATLEDIISYWMEANGFSAYSAAIAERLRDKANEIDW
jgi:hypothetical protein